MTFRINMPKQAINKDHVVLVPTTLENVPEKYIGISRAAFTITFQVEDGLFCKSEFGVEIPFDSRKPIGRVARKVGNTVISRSIQQLQAGINAVDKELENGEDFEDEE